MSPVAATVEAPTARHPAQRSRAAAPSRLFVVLPPPPAAAPGQAAPATGRSADALYRQHGPIIYRRCLRLLRNPEAARDATQEVFLRLVRDAPDLLDREDLTPWLYRVATNHCLNLKRDARHRGETALEDGSEPSTDRPDDHLDSILVKRLLARFDAVTQLIAVAVLVDEREHEEVAAALGLSRRTMARKLDRFLELARRHLVVTGDASASRH
jgi:RNA polymerase sigma-70 factor, ECF subfamily